MDSTNNVPPFFTFDGVDGAGKSTQIELFVQWLKSLGHNVVTCRDPGTTAVGEKLRSILLESTDETPISPRSEALIYMAARAQLVHEIIRPALEAGKVVVSDRFLLANVVYQGYGFGMDVNSLWRVGDFATGELNPTKTILLDMDVSAAAARRTGKADRMEKRNLEYFEKLRAGFLTESKRRPDEIAVIDASQSIERIHQDIQTAVGDCLTNQ
jgi:dTMP kinase